MTSDFDDENLKDSIRKHYLIILKREPDPIGLNFHLKRIKNNEIALADLPNILKNSLEYQEKQKESGKNKGSIILGDDVLLDDVTIKKIGDNFLLIDKNDKPTLEAFSQKNYEKTSSNALKKLLKKGMTAINIGANIGYFTLLMAKYVGPKGRVFAFEPSLRTSKILEKNMEINGCSNVTVIPKGVSNKVGKFDLWAGSGSVFNFVSKKAPKHDPRLYKTSIDITTIDEFLKEKNLKVDFIQIDAEGSEKYIFEGMKKTLEKNPDLELIIEYNPFTLELAGTSGEELLELVSKLGFHIHLIDETSEMIQPVKKEKILQDFEKPKVANLFLTKKSSQKMT